MAVTVLNQPTSPNASKTKLVYTISGSNANQPQFQYVTDIYVSGSSNLLTRLYTYPNLQGSGIVDVAKILDDNLEYDNDWKTTGGTIATDSFKSFDIRFGEAYGTSISSSVTIYTGSTPNILEVFPVTVDPNLGSFNFQDSGSFQLLSNQTQGYISTGNHVTVPVLVPPFSAVGTKELRFEFVNAAGSIIASSDTGVLPGANYEIYQYAFGSGSTGTGTTFETGAWEKINVYDSGSALLTTFNRVDECNGEGVTFAFVNHYGYYDYYSIPNPIRKVTNLTRKTYEQTEEDYSSTISTYSISKRGLTNYNISFNDTYEVTTPYVDKPTADWITELLDSPEVFIQVDGNFLPVIIANSTYDWNMDQTRQKLFQYNIQFRYANKRLDR